MKCWICSRQARGLGCSDNRYRCGDPRRYPVDWVFCSRRCQNAFHKLYGTWSHALNKGLSPEAAMVDATPLEKAAMRTCLKFFGEAASAIGFDKPLGAYSEVDALSVIEAIVTAYVDEMAAQHERSKYPPVHMLGTAPISDPIMPPTADSFADLEDDRLWETKP
ncbi:hypothetical protein SAMN04515620_11363 [Collimonas sp. OK607]|uniref:DUF6511 domain-containing protein n=1 Tax=Collimonas sp. OK607 TaxID=1798194 RepID=UPI0008DECAE9|nr:DUF6511 domain-containing protein [Collimonas sp. OK607]SFB02920.1 hypothetical protein SAMN04515620_11363 [Collimonas sp. OK607]